MQKKNDAIVIQTASDTSEFNFIDGKSELIVYDPAVFTNIDADFFSDHYWRKQNAITGCAKGRGTTWFFQHQDCELVLRHYYRGGMIGKVLNDQYLFTGMRASRAYREFELLAKLRQLKLPVPAPAAMKVQRNAFVYCTNDIISTRIANTNSLANILGMGKVAPSLWLHIGAIIRRFHNHGVFHHDLNAHNILIDAQESAWLIDFDQGEIRSRSGQWKNANLARLKRSLDKEQNRGDTFHFHTSDWAALLQGYEH